MKSTSPMRSNRQRGATAIEFVVLFGILFGVLYSIIAYSIPLLLMLTFQHTAAEAARASIAVVAGHEDYAQRIEERIEDVIRHSWLYNADASKRWYGHCAGNSYGQLAADGRSLEVCIRYRNANYNAAPIVPALELPLLGQLPRLPERIEGRSSIRL
ncbi:TadE/TadG family type IV pilus assembly protein [Stutzerimonas kirkiae]|nr:TadE/TadG family type IV pilus assembly protein [Stutzerimonas kirkiae]